MKFLLLEKRGNHRQHGTIYTSGDIIDSESDLTLKFKNKFRRIDPNEGLPTVDEIAESGYKDPEEFLKRLKALRAKKGSKKKVLKKLSKKTKDDRGVDVTDTFPAAKEDGFKVFRQGSFFHVFEGNEKKPLNEKGLKKGKVVAFLKDYLEA